MRKCIRGIAKCLLFCCFLAALAGFSGMATVRYIFATGQVEIPDLVGKKFEYAADLLAERHLRIKPVDQQLDLKIPKDHVLAQEPAPGTKIQKKHTVRVIVSKGIETTTIPNVIRKPWQEARRVLRQNSFRVGNVVYARSEEVPVDAVIAQTPEPYSEVSTGERVDLLVSRGPYKKVMVMPDLIEEQLPYALAVIEKLGLVLSKVEYEKYPVPENTVLSQIPKPGTLIEEQNIVTFVVSGEPGQSGFMPGPASPVQYKSLEYVVPPGRFDREVSVVVRNAEGITEIYRQLVPPGELIIVRIPVVGETVVEVYLDGTLDAVQRMND